MGCDVVNILDKVVRGAVEFSLIRTLVTVYNSLRKKVDLKIEGVHGVDSWCSFEDGGYGGLILFCHSRELIHLDDFVPSLLCQPGCGVDITDQRWI